MVLRKTQRPPRLKADNLRRHSWRDRRHSCSAAGCRSRAGCPAGVSSHARSGATRSARWSFQVGSGTSASGSSASVVWLQSTKGRSLRAGSRCAPPIGGPDGARALLAPFREHGRYATLRQSAARGPVTCIRTRKLRRYAERSRRLAPRAAGAPERRVVRVISLNADDHIETEANAGHHPKRDPVVWPISRESTHPRSRPARHGRPPIPVYHLHGFLPRKQATSIWRESADTLVFTDSDYWATVASPLSFANRVIAHALHDTACLFIGLSMHDVNVLRWIGLRYHAIAEDKAGRERTRRSRRRGSPPRGAHGARTSLLDPAGQRRLRRLDHGADARARCHLRAHRKLGRSVGELSATRSRRRTAALTRSESPHSRQEWAFNRAEITMLAPWRTAACDRANAAFCPVSPAFSSACGSTPLIESAFGSI